MKVGGGRNGHHLEVVNTGDLVVEGQRWWGLMEVNGGRSCHQLEVVNGYNLEVGGAVLRGAERWMDRCRWM